MSERAGMPNVPELAVPAPETLLASAMYLMTNHAKTRCPLVSRMIAQQLLHLAHHPSESVTPQLRRVCAQLAGQWQGTRDHTEADAALAAATAASTLLH